MIGAAVFCLAMLVRAAKIAEVSVGADLGGSGACCPSGMNPGAGDLSGVVDVSTWCQLLGEEQAAVAIFEDTHTVGRRL